MMPGQRFGAAPAEQKSLPRFNLDFPGGTPRDLVNAIEKALSWPQPHRLNVIIPEDCGQLKIPTIKVENVTLPQLFAAVTSASKKMQSHQFGNYTEYSYGFRTEGDPTESSIWTFYQYKAPESPPVSPACKFYQLSPFLDAGYKVEDITTAIETAWKMLEVANPPQIKYHKDTKLLIAVGAPDNLRMIDDALQQLSKASPNKRLANAPDSEKAKSQ